MSSALSALAPGQNVLLSWDHEYVTRSETVDGRETSSSYPERTVTKLEPEPESPDEASQRDLMFLRKIYALSRLPGKRMYRT